MIQLCSVHILRAITRKLHSYTKDGNARQIAIMFITEFIHCQNMKDAVSFFYTLKYVDTDIEKVIVRLSKIHSAYSD